MKNIRAAKYYAYAFYPFIEQEFAINISKIEEIAGILGGNAALSQFFSHPLFGRDKKQAIVAQVFKDCINQAIERLLMLLIEKRKISYLPEIARQLKKIHSQNENEEQVFIKSADNLSDDEKNILLGKIGQNINKKVFPNYAIDKKLISGIIIKIGDRKIDYSLKGKLNRLKEALTLNIA